jgi:hypothetical protein
MTAWKLGLCIITFAFAGGCGSDDEPGTGNSSGGNTGSSSGGTGMTGGDSGATGSTTSGTTGGASNGASNGGSTGASTGATGTTGNTSNGSSGGTTAGANDGDGGPGPTGACTNAADKSVIDAQTIEKLACEGAACAGKNLLNAAGQTKCIASEAPSLKQLSVACQACFDAITSCVPAKCVSGLGGSGECSLALPNTDFAKCPATTPPEATCEACQMRECAPAFTACSGIAM